MKLFKTKDPELWKSKKKNLDNNELNNFELAKKHMLPQETHEFKLLSEIDIYLRKHVLVEIIYFLKRDKYHFENNIRQLSEKMKKSFNHHELLWNNFTP